MNEEFDIPTISMAEHYLGKALKEKRDEIIFATWDKNQGKHKIIATNKGNYYYFMFKKEVLRKWNELYPQLLGIKNPVERVDSINIPLFYDIYDNKRIKEIIIVYGDHSIVSINKEEWLKRANENSLYRHINKLDFNKSLDYSGSDEYENARVMSTYFKPEEIWK